MNGYDQKEIWALDDVALRTMVLRLNDSPLFPAQVTLSQVHSLIVGLQRAFQVEEIRVASTKPQILYLDQDSQIENYYRSAFSALDPELLPKLSVMMPRRTPANVTPEDSLTALAKVFLVSDSVKDLEAAVAQVPEIWASRSDRFVVTEMFHVKAWHHAYLRRSYVRLHNNDAINPIFAQHRIYFPGMTKSHNCYRQIRELRSFPAINLWHILDIAHMNRRSGESDKVAYCLVSPRDKWLLAVISA
ncbi:hypothetical protein PENSUB_5307 [Penicillium subrubescens]|uniref:Uncharacterized protein n=1 Tax=Penicillium subrubescens TaxID=1316194 RepID=A0A1Q5UA59_9EURO|nr:hypothetical protein PENSUB_5307 [Penicillium subrubescens]